MTKKKRGHPDAEEILARPWCYYCERDFDDLKILISHQKAKHFKCERCGRRLNTAGGLSVHMTQVHKENLESVENALPNRSGLSVEIFGMEGIPEDVVQQHNQRVLANFHQAEADRRATTGNPPPGAAAGGPKKPKVEETGDLKARLAAFKAKKAAAATGASSGNDTPPGAGQASPDASKPQSPLPHQQQGVPGYAPPPYGAQASPPQPSFPQPYSQQGYYLPHQQQPPFAQSHSPFNQGPPAYGAPPSQGPPGMGQFQPYPPQPPQYAGSSPPGMFQQNHQQAPSPPQNAPFARPPPGLPAAAPGLPQRPAFGAPLVHPSQMQQMHQGQFAGQTLPQNAASQDHRPTTQEFANQNQPSATEADVDELIANAAKESNTAAHEANAAAHESHPTAQSEDKENGEAVTEKKKSKKDKDKDKTTTRMVYGDNEVSPEEKMAKMPRYAFDPSNRKPETVLGDAVGATTTGVVAGEDDVLDKTGD